MIVPKDFKLRHAARASILAALAIIVSSALRQSVPTSAHEPLFIPSASTAPLSDSGFYELTGTVRINAVTEYQMGVLPEPIITTIANTSQLVVALVVEEEKIPLDTSVFLSATVQDLFGSVYPVSLVVEMNCWRRNIVTTLDAWCHISQLEPCEHKKSLVGYSGIVLLFEIFETSFRPSQLNFSLGNPLQTYFTTLPYFRNP